ncbi:glycosyltransferase family 87 protein [Streptomyces antarcticus]|uniref:glycosyltransferase family 87 protein n=1 Tax=Streptomyces antarcticus TaxID=2996458 RepID=UPI00226FBFFB|nr:MULTISPECIES: glycosyltransferase family 87 protein [unclassified Streptomyces]MCY0940480.1 glycosyltransferase family 87 protein [Streptomyces sp. H34-AA3]MCZ4082401.1 glycosyltransferase family 87 protein [Streptomyces sp. H34-S5]
MTSPPAVRTAILLAALTAALVLTIRKDGYHTDPAGLSCWYAACWLLFAAAAWSLRKAPLRHTVVLVLAGGIAVAATGLAAPPRTSTDSYRYAWDGRVQAAGISPYDHAPADPELTRLRDSWLFPTGALCAHPDRAWIPAPAGHTHCTRINRPQVHTIYPPVAEAYFLLVHALAPDGARHKPLQIGGALLSLSVTAALLLVLRRRGIVRWAAYWAWCPAVPVEAVNNAHADVLGVLLAVVALGVVARRRITGGALLGAAVATKLLPALVLPGALSGVRQVRDAAAVLLPAAAVVAVVYLPYELLSKGSVFGYLGGYVKEEGYDDTPSGSNRYALLRLVLPDSWVLPAVAVGMLAVVWHVLRHGDRERPWAGALLVTGTAFLLLTPGYSWYALLLVALVALDGRWEWLGIAMAGAATYVTGRVFDDWHTVGTTAYAIAAAAVLNGWALRRTRWTPTRGKRKSASPIPLDSAGHEA